MKKWEKPSVYNIGIDMTNTLYAPGNGGGNGGGTNPGKQNHGCSYCYKCFQSTKEVKDHIELDHPGLDPDFYIIHNASFCKS